MAADGSRSFIIPRFTLPGLVATIGRKLPQWPHALALTTALNAAVKMKLLPQDSLDLLEGRRFLIEVQDSGGEAAFSFRGGLFRPLFVRPQAPAAFDLVVRANLSAFLQLVAHQEDPDTLFFNRELAVEGDTELGLVVKNMLDAIDWPKLPRLPGFASPQH